MNNYYLPLDKFHIVSIRSLEPEAIKIAAKKHTIFDREEIKLTTLLNSIAKSLGFSGGFAGYKKEYTTSLIPFLKKHNLKNKVELINAEVKENRFGPCNALMFLKRQDLSERLFYSNESLPLKVYTGYKSDFLSKLSQSQYEINCFNEKISKFKNKDVSELLKAYELRFEKDVDICYEKICNNIDIALNQDFYHEDKQMVPKSQAENSIEYALIQFFNRHVPINKEKNEDELVILDRSENFSTLLLGALYRNNLFDFHTQLTYLADNLFFPQIKPVEIEMYNLTNETKEKLEFIYSFFREILNRQTEGWVDIIPFNDNLIFLKGNDGEYDFIFKNQRDKAFEHQIYGNNIKRKDVPQCLSSYNFKRWQYFNYQGFRYSDYHEAEKMYYSNGGTTDNYPGRDVIVKNYYITKGMYSEKTIPSSELILPNFNKVKINNEYYAVSQLVTIEEFENFISENNLSIESAEFLNSSDADFVEVNCQKDTFPVCVNWYNAMRYITWFNDTNNITSRLLSIEEFSFIRGNSDITIEFDTSIAPHEIMLINKEKQWMPHRDSYHNEHKFFSILLNEEKWIESKSQLSFMRSDYFAEWLAEETCVRTGSVKDFFFSNNSSYDILKRGKPPLDSCGMYKGVKIGFRLIYKLNFDSLNTLNN